MTQNGRQARQQSSPIRDFDGARDQFLERPLPSNVDAERAVCGAIQIDNTLIEQGRDLLDADDFYSPFTRAVYKAELALADAGKKIEPILIGEELAREGKRESYGGVAAISNLMLGLPHVNSIEHYAKLIKEKSLARQLIKTCYSIVSEVQAEEEPALVTLDSAEKQILQLVDSARKGEAFRERGFQSLKELEPEFLARIEAYHRNETNALTTGMSELDMMLDGGGLQPMGIYYVIAPPKTGKTALALGWAVHVADFHNRTVLGVSAEMNKFQYLQRLFSQRIGIPYWMFRPGFHGREYDIAKARMSEFTQLPIKITDSLFTIADLWRHLERHISGNLAKGFPPVGLVIIDYLQIISLTGKVDIKQMYAEVEAVSRELKRMAQHFGIPFIVMSSLNRTGAEENLRPEIHGIRGSGVPAFDAEAVFGLHNPAFVPGKPYQRPPVVDIDFILMLQRNGPTGDIRLKFIGEMMQFLQATDFNRINGRSETIVTPAQHREDTDTSPLWD